MSVGIAATPAPAVGLDAGTGRGAPSAARSGEWSPARRWAFRWLACYLGLYVLQPSPLDFLAPGLVAPWTASWTAIVQAVAGWLGLDATTLPNRSGDTTYNHVQVLCYAVIAVLVATLWSLATRRREHERLQAGLAATVRLYLSLFMLLYGSVKVVKLQFADLSLLQLGRPLGDLTPNGLLWAFMGYSAPYTAFVGAAEMAAGLLLISRRTASAGALLATGVMAQVFALNLAYDVVVKLFSLHLLLMALWLAAPAIQRLFALLVLQRPVTPVPVVRLASSVRTHRWLVAGRSTAMLLAAALLLVANVARREREQSGGRQSLRGTWVVAATPGDHAGVLRLVIERDGRAAAMVGDGAWRNYAWTPSGRAASLSPAGAAPGAVPELEARRTASDELLLEGRVEGRPLRVVLRRSTAGHRLTGVPFRWVREAPVM